MRKQSLSRQRIVEIITGHSLAVFFLVALGMYTFTLHAPGLVSLIASSASSLSGAPSTMYFVSHGDKALSVGETQDVDLAIKTRVPINVVSATISFPRDAFEIVGISKKDSFLDLWTEDTIIREEDGEIHFSGGTTKPGGLDGTGTILTFSIRSKRPGDAVLTAKDIQVFASNGEGAVVDTDVHSLTYITSTSTPDTSASGGASASHFPDPDLNGDGRITIADVTVLAIKMLSPYDSRFDLNGDGRVNIGDLSVLFSKM